MDEYLSRRIKNWAAWQHPDTGLRKRLLEQAAGGAPEQVHTGLFDIASRWTNRISSYGVLEKDLSPARYSRHTQLAYLNLEIILRTSPIRYA